MRIVRYRTVDGATGAAELADDHLLPLPDGPFASGSRRGTAVAREDVELLPCVAPTSIFGVGRNYRAHIEEMGYQVPELPSLFTKPTATLVGDGGAVVLPPRWLSHQVQHEGELALVIGRTARHVPASRAHEVVAGLTCADDVSARDLQRSDTSNVRGKGIDTFCPVGPWIETDLDLDDARTVTCHVDGELRQSGSTTDLVFGLRHLIAHLSAFTTLQPGDLILTGSPGGSADLHPGADVRIAVEGVGTLHHTVTGPEDVPPPQTQEVPA